MNPKLHASRIGLHRGWTEFLQSLKSPQDQGFYLFMALAVLGYLFIRRNTVIDEIGMTIPQVSMPSILGGLLAFGVVIGPAYQLAMDREDGTLLRYKAMPHGIGGYVTSQLAYHSLGLVPMLLVILVPGFLLFDGLMQRGTTGWLTMIWVLLLGLAAMMPIGIVIGALVPSTQKVGSWGMLPIMVLVSISGIFFPIQALWGWVQPIAQAFPLYWIGLGMRSAFLPDAALAIEVGQSWRTGATVAVLAAWAIVGTAICPPVLRRMARRQSGAAVQAAREQATQWVR
ncbi:ABC transporter permease [Egicoccus sp. AB-alg2]|uniref:ABC transporter permease n=1 Tax=Egicoccus sp. AB-alg2 TaxID=3242693 RepID=UPI00359D5737